jgi:pilus assembly protein Flp/PilA
MPRKETRVSKQLKTCLRDDTGATAIEYGLIAALISVFLIAAITLLGGSLDAAFNTLAAAI